jgi:predicted kinase
VERLVSTLYLIGGVPGSGKTTLAESLLKSGTVHILLEMDQFRYDDRGVYHYVEGDHAPIHDKIMDALAKAMTLGEDIALTEVFSRDIYLKDYLAIARDFKYNVVEILMKSSYESVHKVPPAVVNMMKVALQERIDDDWALITP